jgi:hypothetical protein
MPPTNQPTSTFGSFGAFTPTSTWSSKSTTTQAPQAVTDFMQMMGGNTNPGTQGFKGAPTFEQYQTGIMRDFAETNRVNKENFDRNTGIADKLLKSNLDTAQQLRDYQNPFYDQATKIQGELVNQTKADRSAFDKQAKEAQMKLDKQTGQVNAAYAQAMTAVDEGRTRAASEMSDAMRQNYEADRLKGMGALAGQGISPDQMAEADRQSKWEMERGVGANVANLQFQGAMAKANIQQARAGTLASLANTTASLNTSIMGMGMDQAKAVQGAIKLGYDTAMYRGQDLSQRMDTAAKLETAGYNNWAEAMYKNPVMGVNILPSLLAVGQAAQLTGGSTTERNREEKARSEYMNAKAHFAGLGAHSSGNFDIYKMLQGGMGVPGISAESAAWIRENGIPGIKVIGALGGAGQAGYAPGTAPRGLEARVVADESYGPGGFKQGNADIGSSRRSRPFSERAG